MLVNKLAIEVNFYLSLRHYFKQHRIKKRLSKNTLRLCAKSKLVWFICLVLFKKMFSIFSALDILGPQCDSCTDCPLQAYIKAESASDCQSRGGSYCSNRPAVPDDRRCALISDSSQGDVINGISYFLHFSIYL